MDKKRADSRRSAARAFQKSLEDLQSLLQSPESEAEDAPEQSLPEPPVVDDEEGVWEEAGEDLEEYFQNQDEV